MYREAPAPRAPITISYRAYSGERLLVAGALLLLVAGFIVASVVRGKLPNPGPLAAIALGISTVLLSFVNELRPVAVTIDHTRGIVSFRPGLFARRQEIELALVQDVEIESAVSIVRGNRGPSGPPTPVGRICLVLEDDKIPIDKRMRPDLTQQRQALAKIIAALQTPRPQNDESADGA
jgi:hypothetical protein